MNNKLLEKQIELENRYIKEVLLEIPEYLIQLTKNPIINYCLTKKVGIGNRKGVTPRVVNNWIQKEVLLIEESDKGKTKRFNIIESIWLNILIQLRAFGMSLEVIKRTRELLFLTISNDFYLLKFQLLNSILGQPQTLTVGERGGARIMPTSSYLKLYIKSHAEAAPHITIQLNNVIATTYPNHQLYSDFNILNPYTDIDKLVLLFFLKTGDFLSMKIYVDEYDIRYIENPYDVVNNKDILNILSTWGFKQIIIDIDSDTQTIIKNEEYGSKEN